MSAGGGSGQSHCNKISTLAEQFSLSVVISAIYCACALLSRHVAVKGILRLQTDRNKLCQNQNEIEFVSLFDIDSIYSCRGVHHIVNLLYSPFPLDKISSLNSCTLVNYVKL